MNNAAVIPAKNLTNGIRIDYSTDARVRHTFVQDDALFVATHTEADARAMAAEARALGAKTHLIGKGFAVKVPRS